MSLLVASYALAADQVQAVDQPKDKPACTCCCCKAKAEGKTCDCCAKAKAEGKICDCCCCKEKACKGDAKQDEPKKP
jgi:hypothetical protein